MLLMQSVDYLNFICFDIVVREPESRDTSPKGTRKLCKRVEESVVYNLVDESAEHVAQAREHQVGEG